MKIEIFPSASGDCMLITSADDKRLLADGGLPTAYTKYIAKPMAELREEGKRIDVAYVSHIDRDHIGGILRMLDYEMKWRAYDVSQAKGSRLRKPKVPRPPDIGEIWHNAFLEKIQATNAINLENALHQSAQALSGLNAGTFGTAESAALAAHTEMLALSVGDAIEVNWRIGSDQLDIPLNPTTDGDLMLAQPDEAIELGDLKITVLGPTNKEMRELRKTWNDWVAEKQDYLERLRKQHERDRNKIDTSDVASAVTVLANQFALSIEKDVTPPNLASMVLLVQEGDRRILLTGDAGDESLLGYLENANLFDDDRVIRVDALKVPHHGADNSFSEKFAERVRADNYIFCGDGHHHNPEPRVVKGYLKAAAKNPPDTRRNVNFWFNWSRKRAHKFKPLWDELEAMFDDPDLPSFIKRKSLGERQTRLTFTLD